MRSLFARCHLMTAKDRLNLFLFPSCFLFLLRQLHFQFGREKFISFFGSVWGLWQFGYCAFMFFPQGARGGRRSRTQLQGESPTRPSTGCAGRHGRRFPKQDSRFEPLHGKLIFQPHPQRPLTGAHRALALIAFIAPRLHSRRHAATEPWHRPFQFAAATPR